MNTVTAVPRLRHPIILVHGLFGFDAFRILKFELISYFRGIAAFLRSSGNRVLTPRLQPTGRVARRAPELVRFLRQHVNEPVHIIAYSMGGLDSRYAISRLGAAEQVLTLTTLGTPHRGTAYADWGMKRFRGMADMPVGQPLPGLFDLTTEAARSFNELTPDAPNVRYFSVGGKHHVRFSPEWIPSANIVREAEGDNDGMVSLQSAQYGESFDIWECDHMGLINWPTTQYVLTLQCLDRRPKYAAIVQKLSSLGF